MLIFLNNLNDDLRTPPSDYLSTLLLLNPSIVDWNFYEKHAYSAGALLIKLKPGEAEQKLKGANAGEKDIPAFWSAFFGLPENILKILLYFDIKGKENPGWIYWLFIISEKTPYFYPAPC